MWIIILRVSVVFFSYEFDFKTKARDVPQNEKPCSIKLRCYAACLIGLNECLDSSPGATLADNIDKNKLNNIILNRMSNRSFKQAYVQGFDCEYISFKKYVNMFEHMEIAESIVVVVLLDTDL